MNNQSTRGCFDELPSWVPAAARHYLAHTEKGISIRALARTHDCHPSTILRQVRRCEGLRDDPLIDDALRSLAASTGTSLSICQKGRDMLTADQTEEYSDDTAPLTQAMIAPEALRILRRLCEPHAVLAVAMEMETAVVVRETDGGASLRTATVDRAIAQAMALQDWIACIAPQGRINRYFITNAGRAALRQMTAEAENRASGFGERHDRPEGDQNGWADAAVSEGTGRFYASESPLLSLARRRNKRGLAFLSKDLVKAGELLREDFELSALSRIQTKDRDTLLATLAQSAKDVSPRTAAARARLHGAMLELGPGLGDVVLRCCCLLEGLETAEKALGWSARSAKIVLRIALQRLVKHVAETQGKFGPLIG